jgi:hypothetical protein
MQLKELVPDAIKNNRFLAVVVVVTLFAPHAIPAPLGAEETFKYLFAVGGAFVGLAVGNRVAASAMSVVKFMGFLFGGLMVVIACGIMYSIMLNSIATPSPVLLLAEGILYGAIFAVFFTLSRIADVGITKKLVEGEL